MAKGPTGGVTEIGLIHTVNCIQVKSQEEAEMGAWMEHKTTEASDQFKIISLKESILWKAWSRWEEGLRFAHKQQDIGEAAVRMETTSDQPILTLKLTRGKHEQFETWRGQYLEQPDDFKEEWMDE